MPSTPMFLRITPSSALKQVVQGAAHSLLCTELLHPKGETMIHICSFAILLSFITSTFKMMPMALAENFPP